MQGSVSSSVNVISGKVAEEVGFDKIRRQMAQLDELKIVLVDGMRMNAAEIAGQQIRDTCPKIVELDLSRNLFESCAEIIRICGELESLKSLRLNGNRLQIVAEELSRASNAFKNIKDLGLDEMLLSWEEICPLAQQFHSLEILAASSNDLASLPMGLIPSISSNLTSLNLEYNNFTCLSDLAPLAELRSLERLVLKGNQIMKIEAGERSPIPKFGEKLHYVDLSYNAVESWAFVDGLSDVFPGLTGLRFSHNPVYEGSTRDVGHASSLEEGYMITLGRLGKIKSLNFSNVTPAERTNAEMFYLSRIGKEMANVSEALEHTIIANHKRFADLCDLYGAPTVVRARRTTINPNFLEARLIKFTFVRPFPDLPETIKIQEIPKGFDVYRVKGIVGKLFALRPSGIRLIWETGEWDPVAGYEDEENSADDDDDNEEITEVDANAESKRAKGQWMIREVELEDSTRQIGFCVDGMDARVRVESR